MGTLVQQHAAALSGPGSPPRAGIIIALGPVPVRNNPAGTADASEIAGLHQLPHLPVDAVGPLIEHQPEHHLRMPVRCLIHFPHLSGVDSRRFFHHHMDGALHALDGQSGMVIVRRGHNARVDQTAVQHFFRGFKEGCFFAQPLPGPFLPGGIDVRHGRQFKIGAFPVRHPAGVAAAHIADADDAQADLFFHFHFLLDFCALFTAEFSAQRRPRRRPRRCPDNRRRPSWFSVLPAPAPSARQTRSGGAPP